MESWAKIEFTMATDKDYILMATIAKNFYDSSDHWPVEEYDRENRTISIEEVLATQEDAIGFATELLEELLERALPKASDEQREMIENFTYTMHGHINDTYSECDFIIERNANKLTMKESHFDFESRYEDCDDDNDDEVEDAYEEWADNPDYGEEIDLKGNRFKANEVYNMNETIIEYLKENNLPYDDDTIQNLSVDDVYAILEGTYGKE